jgi:hypothetical protein
VPPQVMTPRVRTYRPSIRPAPAARPSPVVGLGMRERCQLLGGELDARPLLGGGFEVKARLPLAPTGSRL